MWDLLSHVVTAVRKGWASPCATVRPLHLQACTTVRCLVLQLRATVRPNIYFAGKPFKCQLWEILKKWCWNSCSRALCGVGGLGSCTTLGLATRRSLLLLLLETWFSVFFTRFANISSKRVV